MSKSKIVQNPTDKQIVVWHHRTPYFVPSGHSIEVPIQVFNDCLGHEDYADLVIHEVDEGSSVHETLYRLNRPAVMTVDAPVRDTKPVEEVDPDWDSTTCPYDEIEAYITKNNLVIDPDADEAEVRKIVDEHSQG